MENYIQDKLLPYQLPHIQQLLRSFDHQVILDASDTGTGKTYTSIAIVKHLKIKPLIICPKSVINSWLTVIRLFDIEIHGITNYEAIRSGKMYDVYMNYINCPYIKIDVIDNDSNDNDKKKNKTYKLIIETEERNNSIVILDEAHRCKNSNTTNSKILVAIYRSGIKMLLLSATISDKIECFKPFGYIMNFYSKLENYNMWMKRQLLLFRVIHNNTNYTEEQKKIDIIHRRLFPIRGSRMKISQLGDIFPRNQIINQSYFLSNHDEIDQLYKEINQAMVELRIKELRAQALAKIIRCRQRIEILKIPIFLELAEDALENNYNVAIFVNYHETLEHLAFQLDTDCFIHGKQSLDERIQCINEFQNNEKKIIISNIQAGGVGVSLHDLYGVPRMSLISPTWSGQDLVQCLGRIYRAGSKTPAIQKLVFVADTYEDTIADIIKKKMINISGINDNDLIGPQFAKEEIEIINEENNNIINSTTVNKIKLKKRNNVIEV